MKKGRFVGKMMMKEKRQPMQPDPNEQQKISCTPGGERRRTTLFIKLPWMERRKKETSDISQADEPK